MGHEPVLIEEVAAAFVGRPILRFFDGTVGGGGHARRILADHPELTLYLACDRDPIALRLSQTVLAPWKDKIEWVHGSYSRFTEYLDERGITSIDGALFDLGLSSMQLRDEERGFSFQAESPLDMRMDLRSSLTAGEIVNRYGEKELARIFAEYGEEPRFRQAAKAIVEARKRRRIETTSQLVEVIRPVVKKGKLHPATLVFQALRIEVNDELGELKRALLAVAHRLAPQGRIGVISFHSLEDRIVKWFFRDEAAAGRLQLITKKPLVATRDEVRRNPRARSAKLRVAEMGTL